MEDIAELFANLRFAKRIVGGVEERDVWKKLDEVQAAYRRVYEVQHERDLALIEERDETIRKLSASLEQIKQLCGKPAAGVEIPNAPKSCPDNGAGAGGPVRESYQDDEPDVKSVVRKSANSGSKSNGGSEDGNGARIDSRVKGAQREACDGDGRFEKTDRNARQNTSGSRSGQQTGTARRQEAAVGQVGEGRQNVSARQEGSRRTGDTAENTTGGTTSNATRGTARQAVNSKAGNTTDTFPFEWLDDENFDP